MRAGVRKAVLTAVGGLAVLALSGCSGQEKTKVIEVSMNGKIVQCIEWTWEGSDGQIEEVALACDFEGATRK